jgi:hypothetical protein
MSWFAEDYKVPSKGSYMKFTDGDNLVRFLLPPTLGNELWIGGKPQRRKLGVAFTDAEKASADINRFNGQKKQEQHFWACIVWNYKTNSIELLNITQGKVQTDLLNLVRNKKWGSLDQYDINIVRGKTGQQVTYTVQPEPPTPLTEQVKQKLASVKVDMEKYFEGGHPLDFGSGGQTPVSVPDEGDIDDLINE